MRLPQPVLAAVGMTVVVALLACEAGDDRAGSASDVQVVSVRAQTCGRPQPRLGVATVIGDGVAVTAAHVVEGDLRRLEVDGRRGEVLAVDARLDLALVGIEPHGSPRPPTAFDDTIAVPPRGGDAVTIRTADGDLDATVTRALMLRIDDISTGELTERPALELDVVVDRGDSGSPVIDAHGAVVGVVVLRRRGLSVSYASPLTGAALDALASSATATDTGAPTLAKPGACT